MPLAAAIEDHFGYPAANVGLALLINGYDRTAQVSAAGPTIHKSGTSNGTLDATLNDPTVLPVMGDVVVAFAGTLQLFEGQVKTADVTEHRIGGNHLFAKISAADYGPYTGLPITPPWNVSDTGAGGTHAYASLKRQDRATEGVSTTSWQLIMNEDGLWQGMQIAVTSALLGLSAASLNIVDSQVKWQNRNAPQYAFVLGTPLVNLAQIVQAAAAPPAPGSITSTQIADGSIGTPELAANAVTTAKLDAGAVIAHVVNVAGTVVIDDTGATITGGALTVRNPGGTVIIDGSSDMFRILATGTQSVAVAAAGAGTSVSTSLPGLGALASTPAALLMSSQNNGNNADRFIGTYVNNMQFEFAALVSGGAVTNRFIAFSTSVSTAHIDLDGSSFARITTSGWNTTAAGITVYTRYYVLAQTAI